MEFPNKRRQYLKAQFTVEAALLMVIILPVLIGVLHAGFDLHDKVYLNGVNLERTSMYINTKNAGIAPSAEQAEGLSGVQALDPAQMIRLAKGAGYLIDELLKLD